MPYVREVARALHFYQDLVGLKTVHVCQFDVNWIHIWLQSLDQPSDQCCRNFAKTAIP
jgi:hypothetical protein